MPVGILRQGSKALRQILNTEVSLIYSGWKKEIMKAGKIEVKHQTQSSGVMHICSRVMKLGKP